MPLPPVVILYAIFVLSGAAGLMYESIWSRYLGLFVGHGAYAQILVLVIFLGGMSLGAALVGRRSERLREPLRWYAAAELAVAVIGLVFHGLFVAVTEGAYDGLFPRLPAGALVTVVKWTIAALLILPQSVLLGTTFPLMSAGALRRAGAAPGRTLACSTSPTRSAPPAGCSSPASGWWRAPGCRARCRRPRRSTRSSPSSPGWCRAPSPSRCARRRRSCPRCPTRSRRSRPHGATGARPRAARRRLRHGGRVVRLRDRLDPHALAGRGKRHALVRDHALGVHPRPRARRLVGAPPRRPVGRPGARPRARAVDDGRARRGHAPVYLLTFRAMAGLLDALDLTASGYRLFGVARYLLCLA
jgi:hypothetical protein